MANIGFIGLGIMGKPMAGHLIKGGHSLFLHSRSGVPTDLVALGGRAFSSPKVVAQHADIIITMLPDTPDVEKVLFGENGVVEGLEPHSDQAKMIVDMSSISPLETRKFATRLNVLGQDYIRTARAKGLPERTVIWKHGFRNALFPLITLVDGQESGLSFPVLGIEVVFVELVR